MQAAIARRLRMPKPQVLKHGLKLDDVRVRRNPALVTHKVGKFSAEMDIVIQNADMRRFRLQKKLRGVAMAFEAGQLKWRERPRCLRQVFAVNCRQALKWKALQQLVHARTALVVAVKIDINNKHRERLSARISRAKSPLA